MPSDFEGGTHFLSQLIEREHVDQAAPNKLAPLALHPSQMTATLEDRQCFVVPQQLCDRERVRVRVDVGCAHDRQRDTGLALIDADDAPPAWHARATQLALRGDQPRAVEHLRVAAALPRPASEGVGLALDLVTGEFAVDQDDVDSDAAFAEAQLVNDEGIVAEMLGGQVRTKRHSDVVIVHPWGL